MADMATEISVPFVTRKDRLTAIALALLLGFVMQVPHLFTGRAHVNLDWRVHYNYALEYAAAMQAGNYWPRWAFMAQEGMGEPGLLYYAPFYYLLAGGLAQIIGNVWLSMQIVEIFASAATGYFAFSLARAYAPNPWAFLAVPLAVLSPMLCLLQLGFNGYPWASAIAPLSMLVWAVLRPEAEGNWFSPAASIALALTIITHTVTGLMGVFMLAVLPLASLISDKKNFLKSPAFWSPLLILVPALLLSAFYLFPAFLSQNLINADVWRVNYTPFNAFSLSTITAWVFGFRWFAFQWPIPLVALVLSGVAAWLLRGAFGEAKHRHFMVSATTILIAILFLSTELSYPLWLINSPLRNIQFPHRFISVLVPLTAVLVPIAMARASKGWLGKMLGVGAFLSIGMGTAIIVQQTIKGGKPINTSETYFAPYIGLDEYRTAQSLRLKEDAKNFDFQKQCAALNVTCDEGRRNSNGMHWFVKAQSPAKLSLPVYCFPSWSTRISGSLNPHECDSKTGLISLNLPAGNSDISLEWNRLPNEKTGFMLSFFGLVLIGGIGVISRRGKSTKPPS
jgi:hypothetical protein